MGESINRIEREFIITNLMDKKTEIQLHIKKDQIVCFINQVEKDYLELLATTENVESVESGTKTTIFFLYFGHVMTFQTEIKKIIGNKILISIPKDIYKNLLRKHVRIHNVGDLKVSFLFKGSNVELDLPKAEEVHFHTEEKNNSAPIEKGKIVQLINEFKLSILKHVSEENIKMFRNVKPETLAEKLITSTGRIWYIPAVDQGLMENDFYPDGRLVTKKSLITYYQDNLPDKNWKDEYTALLTELKSRSIYSEILCPIRYKEYIAGYVRIANTVKKSVPLSRKILDYVMQFSKVLTSALEAHDYFKATTPGQVHYSPIIVDISASGLLFMHDSEELDEFLVIYGDLKLELKTADRKIGIPSRVMRKYKSGKMIYYGLQFLNVQREDFRYLFEFLYGRPFTLKEQDRWEGGGAPPKIKLS